MRLLFTFMSKEPEKLERSRDERYNREGIIPKREGVYLALGVWGDDFPRQIEVYLHPIKGLCCFCDDFGASGQGIDDRYDCHVSVQNTGLEFLSRLRDLD